MMIVKEKKKLGGSLTDKVYQELRGGIISGKTPSGARLVESVLASEMKVSRTPIREALQRLALEGFVYAIPRAGYVVETMSERDIKDLFATRTEIEKIAVSWAVERISPEETELLEENLQKTNRALAIGKTEQMMELDTEFHQIIYRATRSKTLHDICQALSDHTLKFRIACIHLPEVSKRAKEGHTLIYRALQKRSAEHAKDAVIAHMETVERDILSSLERLRNESFYKNA